MKKITLTILATILLFSFGCSKKPQTIEEKAKAEVQSFYDAIDDGKFLSHTYNSDFIEDRVFLNHIVNTAVKNTDEDIFNQAMQTIGSFADVISIQSDNITTYIVKTLIAAIEESDSDFSEEEIIANEKEIAKGVKSFANTLKNISSIKFEELHKHNAFEYLISKFDKSISMALKSFISTTDFPKSADDLTFIEVDSNTAKILYKDNFDSPLFLRLNNEKWELYEFLDEEKICFKPSNEDKVEILNEIAAGLRCDENDEDGIYEKAKAIQELKLIEESFAPLKEKMEYESFEKTVDIFMFMLMMILC